MNKKEFHFISLHCTPLVLPLLLQCHCHQYLWCHYFCNEFLQYCSVTSISLQVLQCHEYHTVFHQYCSITNIEMNSFNTAVSQVSHCIPLVLRCHQYRIPLVLRSLVSHCPPVVLRCQQYHTVFYSSHQYSTVFHQYCGIVSPKQHCSLQDSPVFFAPLIGVGI